MVHISRFILVRFTLLAVMTAGFSFLLALPALLEQPMDTWYFVSPAGMANGERVYTITDTNRRMTATQRLISRDVFDAQWLMAPPLILERTQDGVNLYTLSVLDPMRATLTPVIRLTTVTDIVLFVADFAVHRTPNGFQAAVYLPDGSIWISESGSLDARLLATAGPALQFPLLWSPDGEALAVKDNRLPSLMIARADGTTIHAAAPADSWPVWSPDSRYILFTATEVVSRNVPIAIVDTVTGAGVPVDAALQGRVPQWCAAGMLSYVVQNADMTTEVRLTDLSNGQTALVMPPETLPGHVVLSITPLEGHGCDWLLIGARTFNEQGTRIYLVHPASGDIRMIGHDVRVISVAAESIEYELVVDGVVTRRSARLSLSRDE